MTTTNRNLQAKQAFLKKKWYHLKTSNYGEKEYRIKEKALQQTEIEETAEIKQELFKRLCSLGLPGFKTEADIKLELCLANGISKEASENYKLDDRHYLYYNRKQFAVLEKLLAMDFSNQPRTAARPDPDSQYRKKQMHFPNLARREKKVTIVKLSKQIAGQLENLKRELSSSPEEIKAGDMHLISSSELDKINQMRSDKSYYDEADIEKSFEQNKQFLTDLLAKGNFNLETIDNEKIGKLVDAASFSLNGVHYYQKFKKTKSMIHPTDILYLLSKFS